MITTTWKHTFTNYSNLENINISGKQHLEIFQPLETKSIRLQLNNLYDNMPLIISSLEIYTDMNQKKSVTLSGVKKFTVEPGLIEWSDWIDLEIPAKSYLSIDIVSPNQTIHTAGLTISNSLIKTENSNVQEPKYFFGVSEIQVHSQRSYKQIAFFGDSLTNQGNFSAPLSLELETNFHIMTSNFGISGNRLLHPGHSTSQWSISFGESGYTRFDHMLVDSQPNIVIFMEGINDLLHPGTGTPIDELPSANAIVKAIKQLKAKCKKFDITFVPMTITPAGNSINGDTDAWNSTKENLRQQINIELLKMPHIIDLATLVGINDQLKSAFDCGDHVHFSTQGGKMVAQYIEEQLIRKKMI